MSPTENITGIPKMATSDTFPPMRFEVIMDAIKMRLRNNVLDSKESRILIIAIHLKQASRTNFQQQLLFIGVRYRLFIVDCNQLINPNRLLPQPAAPAAHPFPITTFLNHSQPILLAIGELMSRRAKDTSRFKKTRSRQRWKWKKKKMRREKRKKRYLRKRATT